MTTEEIPRRSYEIKGSTDRMTLATNLFWLAQKIANGDYEISNGGLSFHQTNSETSEFLTISGHLTLEKKNVEPVKGTK